MTQSSAHNHTSRFQMGIIDIQKGDMLWDSKVYTLARQNTNHTLAYFLLQFAATIILKMYSARVHVYSQRKDTNQNSSIKHALMGNQ
jgi:hypothetical protein